MKFKDFAKYLQELEEISSRNEITVKLSEIFKEFKPEDIKPSMYLVQGRLLPRYESLEFNIAKKLILRSLSKIAKNDEIVKNLFSQTGDVGLVAFEIIKDIASSPTLLGKSNTENTVSDVYKKMMDIALLEGKGSQDSKMQNYIELVSELDPLSAKYATRVIMGEMRLGISDKTILDALSWYKRNDKSLRKNLDAAFGAKADIGELAELVINSQSNNIEEELEKVKVTPGIPVAAKLVERESNVEKVWKRMPGCYVQPKLDGLRGQLHLNKSKNEVHIFSRNMESLTSNFPDIVESLNNLNIESVILDSEIIGFDLKNNQYLTYQETMQRRRKYNIAEYAKNIPVKAMCFDILYLNGEDLTNLPIEERLRLLNELFNNNMSEKTRNLDMLETIKTEELVELNDYFEEKIGNGLEGVITKQVSTDYEPGSRNFKWIKLKANTKSELVDTIDVAVIGYYVGSGQRAKFGIGALLTAVYDPETDKYYSIGKVGSGLTDEMLQTIVKDLSEIKIENKPDNYEVKKTMEPDVWVKPKIIIEIDADEITRSPNHTAATGYKTKVKKDNADRGLSIRFPRIKVWNRDKDYPNSVQEIVRMYELRKSK